jgi:hypothetical protein
LRVASSMVRERRGFRESGRDLKMGKGEREKRGRKRGWTGWRQGFRVTFQLG